MTLYVVWLHLYFLCVHPVLGDVEYVMDADVQGRELMRRMIDRG